MYFGVKATASGGGHGIQSEQGESRPYYMFYLAIIIF